MGSAVGWTGTVCAPDASRRSFVAASQSHSQTYGFNKSDVRPSPVDFMAPTETLACKRDVDRLRILD